jgi:ABC-type arginine/histidine transport system permease subunit
MLLWLVVGVLVVAMAVDVAITLDEYFDHDIVDTVAAVFVNLFLP